jgi:hypothetical protein
MLPVGYEPTIPEGELPQTYALHRAVTGIGRNPLLTFVLKDVSKAPADSNVSTYTVVSTDTSQMIL